MAKSVDKRYEEIYNLGINEHNKNKETKKQTAQSDKQIINANADANIENITNNYNTQIADTNKSYENAFQQNELQVKLNERHLERKAAEMGLTDSGLNRTQLTANQMSYANQKGEISRQKQKAVDTLAATMRSKITEVNTNRNNQIAQIDSALNNDLAQMDLDYASAARQQATDIYNAEYKAEQEREAERIKAEQENKNKYINVYDNKGNVVNKYTAEERKKTWSDLVSAFDEKAVDVDQAAKMIYDFGIAYDLTDAERAILLKKSGINESEFKNYITTGSIYTNASDYEQKAATGNVGRVDWNYKKDGKLNYKFKLTNNTFNWFGGTDANDELTIYYPDGTMLAEKVKIKDLPKNIRKAISEKTNGKTKNYEFTYNADLKESSF